MELKFWEYCVSISLLAFKRKNCPILPYNHASCCRSDFGDLLGHNHWVGGGDLGLSESSVVEGAAVLVAVSVDATVHPSAPACKACESNLLLAGGATVLLHFLRLFCLLRFLCSNRLGNNWLCCGSVRHLWL